MKKSLLFLAISIVLFSKSYSQVNIKDSSIFTPLLGASYAYQIPGGHLAERFGNNSNLGITSLVKTKKNWLCGFDANFIFGDQLREDSIFKNISTQEGAIINQNGELAQILMYERGYTASFKLGKLFNMLAPNPNSGIMALGGIGFIQHKIRIENTGNNAPQVLGDYKKGYDRLTNGLAITEFIGYMYLGNKRLVNFYGGLEFTQAWTQNRRSFNFDTMEKDDTKRNDYLSGIRIGWIIPLYKKMPNKFYYY